MDCNTNIELNQTEQAVSSLTIDSEQQQQQGYQPTTLNTHNRTRCIYLPLFPTISFSSNDSLLLANIPTTHLAPHEIASRRQHEAYTSSDTLTLMNNYNYSNDNGFNMSQQDAEELAARLQVSMSIITFNAQRLREICYFLLTLHESFRRNVLHKRDVALKEPTLNSKQMAILLEFYLQIDVDIFYMKTCSFRGAQPRSNVEGGLFCSKDEPQATYTMLPCGSLFCRCCHSPSNDADQKKTQLWPVVDFSSSSMHRFVNGYTTYLNCPATCNTSNIIYTMTCPCGYYDYVDSTAETLGDAMAYHREHGNRIIHEMLTGSPVYRRPRLDPNETEKEIANKMRLYQHSARCPTALRLFLNCNPIYWCFIPIRWDQALDKNISYVHGRASSKVATTDQPPPPPPPELHNVIPMLTDIQQQMVADCLDRVPIPSAAYICPFEQREKQRLFFETSLFSSLSNQQRLPYVELDLYKVAIIAVLPDDRSLILRYIIETLFIIHGEPKLNMICPIGIDPEKHYGRAYDLDWCANLNCPSVTTT